METSEQLKEVLEKERKSLENNKSFSETYKMFDSICTPQKSSYSFPLLDTLGRTFYEQTKYKTDICFR
jgi:hypothetical protein